MRKSDLHQLYKYAEFGKLASELFHDISTPVTLVSLNLSELERYQVDERQLSKAKLALEQALLSTKRLEEFVKAAKQQIQNKTNNCTFEVGEQLRQLLVLYQPKFKTHQIQVNLKQRSKKVLTGDLFKFQQVIQNLLSNTVDALETSEGKRKISIQTTQTFIKISDNGPGILPENIPKIFTPFFTTKGPDKGTGLGLSIVQEIIEKDFKGSVTVESNLGQGTTFTIFLPEND